MPTTPTPSPDDLVKQALSVQQSDPDEAARCFTLALQSDPSNLAAHNGLERLGAPGCFSRWMRVNCVIHPQDDIFRFFSRHPSSIHPVRDYLADGWRTLAELMVLLERVRRPLLEMGSVLEFASGFGRFTRHLVKVLPGRVTCSDVLPGSVDFVRDELGAEGFYSSHEPEALRFPRRYELVFVLSLFTHLPVSVWGRWLRALANAVAPGGLLLFSVHSEELAREHGITYGRDGAFFVASSESPSLSAEKYGTTFTTREAVAAQVMQALGKTPLAHERNAFWAGQDAVIVRL
jgi:SAM-dependent methyltransferase